MERCLEFCAVGRVRLVPTSLSAAQCLNGRCGRAVRVRPFCRCAAVRAPVVLNRPVALFPSAPRDVPCRGARGGGGPLACFLRLAAPLRFLGRRSAAWRLVARAVSVRLRSRLLLLPHTSGFVFLLSRLCSLPGTRSFCPPRVRLRKNGSRRHVPSSLLTRPPSAVNVVAQLAPGSPRVVPPPTIGPHEPAVSRLLRLPRLEPPPVGALRALAGDTFSEFGMGPGPAVARLPLSCSRRPVDEFGPVERRVAVSPCRRCVYRRPRWMRHPRESICDSFLLPAFVEPLVAGSKTRSPSFRVSFKDVLSVSLCRGVVRVAVAGLSDPMVHRPVAPGSSLALKLRLSRSVSLARARPPICVVPHLVVAVSPPLSGFCPSGAPLWGARLQHFCRASRRSVLSARGLNPASPFARGGSRPLCGGFPARSVGSVRGRPGPSFRVGRGEPTFLPADRTRSRAAVEAVTFPFR
ncbi:unnamed protein product [Dicrocoelium dendriticum]|nr:unnamed protein product [Dicrocoelium dendriticum]